MTAARCGRRCGARRVDRPSSATTRAARRHGAIWPVEPQPTCHRIRRRRRPREPCGNPMVFGGWSVALDPPRLDAGLTVPEARIRGGTVPLSDEEARLLHQLEQSLAAEDPDFASTLRGS